MAITSRIPHSEAEHRPPGSGRKKRGFVRDNGLTLVLLALFSVSLGGMTVSGWIEHNEDIAGEGFGPLSFAQYLGTGAFLSALFENWESEFLQMSAYVVLTAILFQRGSAESSDPDNPEKPNDQRRDRGLLSWLYAHSLGLALAVLFILSFAAHWLASAEKFNAEAAIEGGPRVTLWSHLGSAAFWFESFQNWQSEFLSTAVLIVLSIFLRQQGSPESKPLNASHSDTGAS